MKFFSADAELPWRSAHLIYRDELAIDIAGCIFHALGHYRPGELLELEREVELSAVEIRLVFRTLVLQEQNVAKKIKAGRGFICVAALGLGHRFMDVRAIALGHLSAFVNISPINREAR